MRNKFGLTISIDNDIMDLIEAQHKATLVNKSVLVNEILKKHYAEELKSGNKDVTKE